MMSDSIAMIALTDDRLGVGLEVVWTKGLAMAEPRDELASRDAAVIEVVVVRKLRRDV